jgi:hypothetical protein
MRSNCFVSPLTTFVLLSVGLSLHALAAAPAWSGDLRSSRRTSDVFVTSEVEASPKTFGGRYRAELKENNKYLIYKSDGLQKDGRDELEEWNKQERAWEMLRNMIIDLRNPKEKTSPSQDERRDSRSPQPNNRTTP